MNQVQVINTFPSISIPSHSNKLPVEVSLIAQLGHGSGNILLSDIANRQKNHENFVDELDEPSAKIGGTNFEKGDPTSLYSFLVGEKGHPFHRHAGHRIFTAISGSGGAQLRFSSASSEQMAADPHSFIRALRFVNIPADCLFTVRFGGETWHQFYPLTPHSPHPVLFALSCHTNELGGDLEDHLKEKIIANLADIPTLTDLLPTNVQALLESDSFQKEKIPTTTLSLDAAGGTLHRKVCDVTRSRMGLMRLVSSPFKNASGFLSHRGFVGDIVRKENLPDHALLSKQLTHQKIDHEDMFSVSITGIPFHDKTASQILSLVLEGFLQKPPPSISWLMSFRNLLVKPIGLRTSSLGCPVSSLLSKDRDIIFAHQYPVLDQNINNNGKEAEVILGFDDKHLSFRSSVGVKIIDGFHAEITLGNKLHCKNMFGKFYLTAIDLVHRHYVVPTMLKTVASYVVTHTEFSREQI